MGVISLILFCFIIFFYVCAYFVAQKRFQKKHKFLDAGIELILRRFREQFGFHMKGDKLERIKKINVGKAEEEIFYTYYMQFGRMISGVVLLGLLMLFLSSVAVSKGELLQGHFIEREKVLGSDKTVELSASTIKTQKDVKVKVPHTSYSKEELKKEFQRAKEYIEKIYLGENVSSQNVTKDLVLPTVIPKSAVTISWNMGQNEIVMEDGQVRNTSLKESVEIELAATLCYEEVEEEFIKSVTVLPQKRTSEEKFWEKWSRQLKDNIECSATSQYLNLPKEIDGEKIMYEEKNISTSYIVLGVFLFMGAMLPLLLESKTKKEIEKREEQLRVDYPEFVERFVLLIGAGLTIKGAWERIAKDYRKREKVKRYVYEEMFVTVYEMQNGMSEAKAYELFGKRTELLPYMKFCTLMVQNMKKGSADLLKLLDYEVLDAFRERKENAKALGEEAGTKLLLPMMLMLAIVFTLIIYAAFRSM